MDPAWDDYEDTEAEKSIERIRNHVDKARWLRDICKGEDMPNYYYILMDIIENIAEEVGLAPLQEE